MKKKVLIIINTGFATYGGLSSVMLNYYRALDKSDIIIDFASTNDAGASLIKQLEANGSRYICLGNRKKNCFKYMWNLKKLIKEEKYDIVHVNGNSATMGIELLVAKYCKVHMRIAHGHTTKSNYPFLHTVLYPVFSKLYTHAIAVSQQTGKWLFKNDYIVLNNAIDTAHYAFSENKRRKFREKYGLDGKFVVGNVGKLNGPKNHSFLLNVFADLKKMNDNAVLIIAGGGELEQKLKEEAAQLSISESVIFMGMVDDAADVLQAMDVFVFPSIFEGLGLSLVEAQAAGLICFASDTVPKETRVSKLVHYISLNSAPINWAHAIIQEDYEFRANRSIEACASIRKSGYDIKMEAYKLRQIYFDI